AGYEGYGYGYGYGQDGSAGFGYGAAAAANSWDLGGADADAAAEGSDGPGKLSQRLEGGAHPDPEGEPGGRYGTYDPYESYDSRSSLNDRDLYRPGYDYNDYNDYHDYNDYPDYNNDYPDYNNDYHDYNNDYNDYHDYNESEHDNDNAYEGPYEPFYGPHREQFQGRGRDGFGQRGQNWGRDGRPPRPSGPSPYPGRGAGPWHEPRGPPGSKRLPSLFSHNILPEAGAFPALRGFPGNGRYGGAKPRLRRNWRMWDWDFKLQRKKLRRDPTARKRKQPSSSDEPDSKAAKTDGSDNSDSDNEEGTEGESGDKEEKEGSRGEGEDEEGRDSEKGALSIQEEISQIKQKLQAGKKTQDRQKKRHRDRMVERIQFVCSLCKYRTFYDDEMSSHLESKFHKEHFKFVGTKLPQQTADFLQARNPQTNQENGALQEYVANKTRKTEERRKGIKDINVVIQQIYRDQDLTQEPPLSLEGFVSPKPSSRRLSLNSDGFVSPESFSHRLSLNSDGFAMMEQSKKSSLVVARSILNNKLISKKLERYLK
ncbi:AKP8L protein, partial [Scytalopus superciliaris]|nr:AKP8L protein [Scytalopus superciliaris]